MPDAVERSGGIDRQSSLAVATGLPAAWAKPKAGTNFRADTQIRSSKRSPSQDHPNSSLEAVPDLIASDRRLSVVVLPHAGDAVLALVAPNRDGSSGRRSLSGVEERDHYRRGGVEAALLLGQGGLPDPDEILTAELAMLKADRIHARATLERIHVAERAPAELAPELIARFGRLMRENLTSGEIQFRKA
ncbi:hypothetical protein [Methylorubrum aminovorans]